MRMGNNKNATLPGLEDNGILRNNIQHTSTHTAGTKSIQPPRNVCAAAMVCVCFERSIGIQRHVTDCYNAQSTLAHTKGQRNKSRREIVRVIYRTHIKYHWLKKSS